MPTSWRVAPVVLGLCAALGCAKPKPEPVAEVTDAAIPTVDKPDVPIEAQPAENCDAAMLQLQQSQAAVSTDCSARAECGLVELAYNGCDRPSPVNVTQQTLAQRKNALQALETSRKLCGYVHPPCPAQVFGEPICLAGRCESTAGVLGRSPALDLIVQDKSGPIRQREVVLSVNNSMVPGGQSLSFRSDSDGRIQVPTNALGAPGVFFVLTAGSAERRFASLPDLLEASAAPITISSP